MATSATWGTGTLSGTVGFGGSQATQTIGGNATSFGSVAVNKPSGTVQLTYALPIATALTLTKGILATTGAYQVSLATTATISETNAGYVLGKVQTTRVLRRARHRQQLRRHRRDADSCQQRRGFAAGQHHRAAHHRQPRLGRERQRWHQPLLRHHTHHRHQPGCDHGGCLLRPRAGSRYGSAVGLV